jgi:hypothetical protein
MNAPQGDTDHGDLPGRSATGRSGPVAVDPESIARLLPFYDQGLLARLLLQLVDLVAD